MSNTINYEKEVRKLLTGSPEGIPYVVLIDTIRKYLAIKNSDKPITEFENAYWQAFLKLLREIENSIPRSSKYENGTDDHSKWLERVFQNFLRPYMEEDEVVQSDFGKENNLTYYKFKQTGHDTFHKGPGLPFADLVSITTKKRYDVKHDHVDANKAHDAEYLINYQNSGTCLIYDVAELKSGKAPIDCMVGYFDCASISQLLNEYGLPYNLFIMQQKELEEFFNFQE